MAEIKTIHALEFGEIKVRYPFREDLLLKDYYLTRILYALRDVKGIYFKGGTALNKIFLNHSRLSEDLDFTLTRNEKEVKEEIISILEKCDFFKGIRKGRDFDNFTRIIVECETELGKSDILIDLNQRAKLFLPSESNEIKHFYYPFVPKFSIKTIAKEEMVAEKLRATIARNKPRDHFDVYQIIKEGIPINLELVKRKCKDSNDEFSVIKMFNKAKTLKNRWDKDMNPLIKEPIHFHEVIKFLAKHFKLKEEKESLKERSK